MIVIDASVAIAALTGRQASRVRISDEELHAPHLIDAEVAHTLRGLALRDERLTPTLRLELERWRGLGLERHSMNELLGRVWELRHNLSAYDATYVALAEVLGAPLVTTDSRLAAAPGVRCTVELLPPE